MFSKFPGVKYMIGSIVLLAPSLLLFGNTNPLAQIIMIATAIAALILGMKGARLSREALRSQQEALKDDKN